MKKGQALAVVLLVMAVGITVALGAVSRSVTEVNVSTVQEEAARALEAAEVGVEKLVSMDSATTVTANLEGSAGYSATSILASNPAWFRYPARVENGDTATMLLNGHISSGANFARFCWGAVGDASTPALELMLYYRMTPTDYRVKRTLVEVVNGRTSGTPAPPVAASGSYDCQGVLYKYRYDASDAEMVDAAGFPVMLRIRMLYNTIPQPFTVQAFGGSIPGQGLSVTSVGSAGEAVQKIEASAVDPDYPPMFDNAIFSGGGLSK